MARSDSDRVERLKDRLARPAGTRGTAIDNAAAGIAKGSRGLQGRVVTGNRRDLEARAEAVMKTYGRVVRRASE
jgi:hypothetical protein